VIQVVDRALEDFLRARVPLSAHAVDVSFQAPDKTWGAALTRPTVNVFLWDVASHAGYLKTGMQQRVNPAGKIERRPLNPVVDLGYLVTAWASERRDEHELLGSVLECVLAHSSLPEEFLPERFSRARCGLSLAPADRRVPGDFWSALEGRLKPGLQLQVALPIEVFEWQPTARPAERFEITVDRHERSGKVAANAAAGRAPGGAASSGPVTNDSTQSPDPSAEIAEPTRRRRNGALVMEARPPRRPEPSSGS
jgi:Pvc16 N-terminal domain